MEIDKAVARRDILQESISMAIVETQASAANLALALREAEETIIQPKGNADEIEALNKRIRGCKEPELKEKWQKDLDILQAKPKEPPIVEKEVNHIFYNTFMRDFYELNLATEMQMTKWVRPQTLIKVNKKGEPELDENKQPIITTLSTADSVNMLFTDWFNKGVNAEAALTLFKEYLQSLKLSGLYDLGVKRLPAK